jgi:hypothetical protein
MVRTQLTAAILLMGMGVVAEEPGRTTLSVPSIRYTVPEKPYVILARGDVEAVVVDHRAVDDAVLPGHRAGYAGVAVLRHARRRDNLFVPAYAGLNFEHIHDGTTRPARSSSSRGTPRRSSAASTNTPSSCTRGRPRRGAWRAARGTSCSPAERSR